MPKDRDGSIEVFSEINQLSGLTVEELRLRWVQVFKRPVPKGSQRDFLLGALAYEIQANAFVPLKASSHRTLCSIAQNQSRRNHFQDGEGPLRPGKRLLRTWQGETHEVLALEKGFSYKGATLTSLSEIARLITGARWSGPVFFGLKKPRLKKAKPTSGDGG